VTASGPLEVSEGIWLIGLPLPFPVGAINVYLIRSRDGFLLLDCGLKTNACREALAAALDALGIAWSAIRQIVVSHLHPDHFGLAAELRRRSGAHVLMHRAEAELVAPHFLDRDFFSWHTGWLEENGVPAAESATISQASLGVAELVDVPEADRQLEDGDRLPIAGGELEAMWSPGHSPGLLTFYCARRKLYFSSDHIIETITPNIGLHARAAGNPLGDYLASLERVRSKEIHWILPAHGRPFSGHREWIRAVEQHHQARCGRMLAAVAGGPRTAYEILTAEWGPRLPPLSARFAVAETLAHMEYLRRQGLVAAQRDNGLIRWRKVK
jgi:glyoxylase-like metal-dependent hydrolase (beta-lactamase superfamily II)